MRRGSIALVAVLLCTGAGATAHADEPAFETTEVRTRCASYSVNRQPYFGELHSHTSYSADAASLDTRNTPRDGYRFARGEIVGLPPFVDTRRNPSPPSPSVPEVVTDHPYCTPPSRCEFTATRTTRIGRPIDFAAITDHAEWLGETNICFFEGTQVCSSDGDCLAGQVCSGALTSGQGRCSPRGHDSPACIIAREDVTRLNAGLGAALFASMVTAENPARLPFCGLPAAATTTCTFQAQNVWQQIIADAEEAYDRSAQCSFTSFIGYEYTSMPSMGQCANDSKACFADDDCPGSSCLANTGGGNNLHRNIIFRNANVIAQPISYIDVPTGCGAGTGCDAGGALASPVQMLQALAGQCNSGNNCDFVSIPHNSNLSGGAMFLAPETVAEAQVRSTYEPLAEISQIKGQSECRYSASHPGAWGTVDEQCDFENMSFAKLGGAFFDDPTPSQIPASSYLREVLKGSLAYKQANGVDPFHLGFVGATDTHNGTPSDTEEWRYSKDAAHGDQSFVISGQALNETNFLGLETNGGGLTVAWAEENSRDSIFSAFKRRETYATSGTRPIVRFFGGFGLPKKMCKKGDFATQGYANGVPMGGTLSWSAPGAVSLTHAHPAPTFAVLAMKDPGMDYEHPGTPLQRIQIVKGWVDASGAPHEAVFEVAGDTHDRAWVDLRSCEPRGPGFADLCAEWTDESFDPSQHAFYYARVLENPSCRWNQYYCLSRGVDCTKPSKANRDISGYTQFEYQQCCSNLVPKTIQERAWTSPIWFSPGGS